MTAYEIENRFNIQNGVIQSPGIFQGEMRYAPFYVDRFPDDYHFECHRNRVDVFYLDKSDYALFPELTGMKTLEIRKAVTGFVYCDVDN